MRKACLRLRLDARTAVRCDARGVKRGGGFRTALRLCEWGSVSAVRQVLADGGKAGLPAAGQVGTCTV